MIRVSEVIINYEKGAHKITVETCGNPVRVEIENTEIASTGSALVLRETGHRPVYYIPLRDVRNEILEKTETSTTCPFKGNAMYYTIRIGEKKYSDAVWRYLDTIREFDGIRDYVAFYSNVANITETGD